MENIIIIKNQIFDASKIEHIIFEYEASAINAYYINMHATLNCGLCIKISSKDYIETIVKIMVYLNIFVEEEKTSYSEKKLFYELFEKNTVKAKVSLDIFTYFYRTKEKNFTLKS